MTTTVSPFPWRSLPRTSTATARAGRAARLWASAQVGPRGVSDALSALLGTPVRARAAGDPRFGWPEALLDGYGVLVARADAPGLEEAILLSGDAALAGALAGRAVRRPKPALPKPLSEPSMHVAGAVAAVVAATLRLSSPAVPLRVLGAGGAPDLMRDLAAFDPMPLTVPLAITLGGETFAAWASIPGTILARVPEPAFDAPRLCSLGDAVVSLPVVASASAATAREVSHLAPGDVWIPGAWLQGLRFVPSAVGAARGIEGTVALVAPRGENGVRGTLGSDGRLVLTGERAAVPWTIDGGRPTMSDESTKVSAGIMPARDGGTATAEAGDASAALEALAEAPVVVRVELGAVEMRAREWATLREGDVVAIGRPVGAAVVLRVSGVEMARGELVDLEGEIGVRILSRATEAH